METLAHLILAAAFLAIFLRRRKVALALFVSAVVFTLFVFFMHVSDKLPLNF